MDYLKLLALAGLELGAGIISGLDRINPGSGPGEGQRADQGFRLQGFDYTVN